MNGYRIDDAWMYFSLASASGKKKIKGLSVPFVPAAAAEESVPVNPQGEIDSETGLGTIDSETGSGIIDVSP